jgi:hypothetical protein
MKFRNPWIDPRIEHTRPEQLVAYLTQRGWKNLGPATNPHLTRYEQEGNEEAPTIFAPDRADDGPSLQWMIEAVEDLARYERRWAVAVLHDIVAEAPENTTNGVTAATTAHAP